MSTPFVTFPGTLGRYVFSDDVNLLDADSAHLQQSVGQWSVGALSTDYPLFGDNSLKVTGGVDTVLTPGTDAAMFSCYVYSVAGATFDVNGSAGVAVPAGTWTQLSETGPDGTYTIGCSTAADYYVGKACVRSGTDSTFVPSLRIVGDLDLRVDVAPDDLTPASDSAMVSNFDSTGADSGCYFLNRASGTLRVVWISSTGAKVPGSSVTLASVGFSDGDRMQLRVTVDMDNGAADYDAKFWYRSDNLLEDSGWTQLGVTVNGGAASDVTYLAGNSAQVVVGRYRNNATGLEYAGDFYAVEMRDGIDGPVVARFDAGDVLRAL